jgi:hypothetical protein
VNESTTNHEKNMGWKNNLCNFENVVKSGIHQTNYDGFQKNGLNWSLHLQLPNKINLSPPLDP